MRLGFDLQGSDIGPCSILGRKSSRPVALREETRRQSSLPTFAILLRSSPAVSLGSHIFSHIASLHAAPYRSLLFESLLFRAAPFQIES